MNGFRQTDLPHLSLTHTITHTQSHTHNHAHSHPRVTSFCSGYQRRFKTETDTVSSAFCQGEFATLSLSSPTHTHRNSKEAIYLQKQSGFKGSLLLFCDGISLRLFTATEAVCIFSFLLTFSFGFSYWQTTYTVNKIRQSRVHSGLQQQQISYADHFFMVWQNLSF